MKKFNMFIFINKSFCLMILCILILQAILASSTLWIIKLSQAVVLKQDLSLWLVLFILSLSLIYIPGPGTAYFQSKAAFSSFRKYVDMFTVSFRGRAQLRTNIEFKQERQPYLNNEAWLVINEFVGFIINVLTTLFNIVFNIGILGFIIDKKLMIAYAITIPLITIAVKSLKPLVTASAKQAQADRTAMMQSLLPAWDSILIGNQLNIHLWKNYFIDKHKNANKSALKSVLFSELTTIISMFLVLFPVIGTWVWLIYQNIGNEVFLSMLIATFPRQVITIFHVTAIVAYASRWNSLKTRLEGLKSALIITEPINVGTISWNRIKAEKDNTIITIDSINSLQDITQDYRPGRITLRGDNGTGKSSLLALIKEQLSEKAVLLPPHSDMFFEFSSNKSLSTGEKIIESLDEIKKSERLQLLLLDEWDANLDKNHIGNISEKLNELAKEICIIEVRHRS
jgi:ABC-type bacteriocin/lantibiotic exporter with double-glycine peptidase domain